MATNAPVALSADGRIRLIRDAEIENSIRAFAAPVFAAAGLDGEAVRIYIVRDSSLNAFVSGGLRLFVNTGLLMASADANQLIGVIAHETGHLAGGHLARLRDELQNATTEVVIATVLGVATALATGRGDAGVAVSAAGNTLAERNVLRYSREQEQAADQAAVTYLERSGQSARGLMTFMEKLAGQDLLTSSRQDPYVRTHPLPRERVDFLQRQVQSSRFADQRDPPAFAEMHARMVAKLVGFLEPQTRVERRYGAREKDPYARYALAVAEFRAGHIDQALTRIDSLLAERPDDPYFHELKGQILFEGGRIAQAIPSYDRAVNALPAAALIRVGLAHAIIETNDAGRLAEALAHLKEAARLEPDNPSAWRLLGIAHGRLGESGLASLALAEYALLDGRLDEARGRAEHAGRNLPEGSPSWIRAQDLLRLTEERLKR